MVVVVVGVWFCGVRRREPTNQGGEAYHLTDTCNTGKTGGSEVEWTVVGGGGGSAVVKGDGW